MDKDGTPHTAPFGSVRAVTPRLLRLISARYHDTYANLARDGRAVVALLAPPDIAVSIRRQYPWTGQSRAGPDAYQRGKRHRGYRRR
jgi:flavin reductase (DIM6/NTAB) family NADH-FMN oxidoreductase RutF